MTTHVTREEKTDCLLIWGYVQDIDRDRVDKNESEYQNYPKVKNYNSSGAFSWRK